MSGVLSFVMTPADIRQVSPVNPLPVTNLATASAADPGYSNFRKTDLSFGPESVKDTPGNLFAVSAINVNTAPVYVKFYDTPFGDVRDRDSGIVAATPVLVVLVPASDGTTPGAVRFSGDWVRRHFATAISVHATIDFADVAFFPPVTPIYLEAVYK